MAVFTDDRRTPNRAVFQLRAFADRHPPRDARAFVNNALDVHVVHLIQNDTIGFQHVVFLSGVQPPASQNVAVYAMAEIDQLLNRIGDLELASAAGFDLPNRIMDFLVAEVNADQSQVRLGLWRLLFQIDDATIAVEHGHAERAGILHFLKKDKGIGIAFLEALDKRTYAILNQIVAQIHDERIIAEEGLACFNRMCQSSGLILQNIFNLDSPALTVPDAFFYVLACLGADDDPYLSYAAVDERFNAVKENRLVCHRQQLLCRRVRDRPHPRAFSAAQDQSLHFLLLASEASYPRRRRAC